MTGSTLDNLARAYIELVELNRQGAVDQARVVYQRIAHQLRAAVEGMWAQATGEQAAGDLYAALFSFTKVLDVLRQNLLNLELSVTKAAVFAEMARVLAAMGQTRAAAAATALAASGGASFYQPAPTCQVAILGALLEALFGRGSDRCFVEVGAYDGESYSNTSCLADRGWRGLYIEPVERAYLKCVERHRANPRVQVSNHAIGPEAATIRFWDNGEFSTGSPDEMALNVASGWLDSAGAREIAVPQVRLDTALRQAGIEPGFDLLVIDVDGMEEAVFQSFDLAVWRPRCMIVELIELSPGFVGQDDLIASAARVRAAIERGGYHTVYRDHGNTVFERAAA